MTTDERNALDWAIEQAVQAMESNGTVPGAAFMIILKAACAYRDRIQ